MAIGVVGLLILSVFMGIGCVAGIGAIVYMLMKKNKKNKEKKKKNDGEKGSDALEKPDTDKDKQLKKKDRGPDDPIPETKPTTGPGYVKTSGSSPTEGSSGLEKPGPKPERVVIEVPTDPNEARKPGSKDDPPIHENDDTSNPKYTYYDADSLGITNHDPNAKPDTGTRGSGQEQGSKDASKTNSSKSGGRKPTVSPSKDKSIGSGSSGASPAASRKSSEILLLDANNGQWVKVEKPGLEEYPPIKGEEYPRDKESMKSKSSDSAGGASSSASGGKSVSSKQSKSPSSKGFDPESPPSSGGGGGGGSSGSGSDGSKSK